MSHGNTASVFYILFETDCGILGIDISGVTEETDDEETETTTKPHQ